MLREKVLAALAVCLLLVLSVGEAGAKPKRLKGVLSYIVNPISSVKILPGTYPVEGKLFGDISIVAARGEYEPASFVLTPYSSSIDSLKIVPTELKGKHGTIPSSNIDIKAVKCWYQGETAWVHVAYRPGKVLVPELLLNNDSLVKVDYKEEKNYLKLSFPEGEEYVWISNTEEERDLWVERWEHEMKILSVDKFPVKDSPKLLPVNIPAKTNKQFWVTLKVPEDAKPGIYTGEINLSTPKQNLGSIDIRVRVLPFELSEPYYISSIYAHRAMLTFGKGTISSQGKSEKQYRKELENMFAHGITNPTMRLDGLLANVLKIREETGMDNRVLYFVTTGSVGLLNRVKEIGKPYGVSEVYFYGTDEAQGERQRAQRKSFEVLRKAGGKTFVAGRTGTFENIGDVLDLFIHSGAPNAAKAKKWHSIGHRIVSYSNPQVGVENPAVYRRNYGLLLWQTDYDGAMDYCYQHDFGNIWNDFDSSWCRDHVFAYPTVDGVIDTIAWEGYREGVDDVRYVTTLMRAIREAMESENKNTKQEAIKAQEYLDKLKKIGLGGDLDIIRLEIIRYILNLKEEEK